MHPIKYIIYYYLAIPIILPEDKIVNLDNYRSKGLQEGEEELENVNEEEEGILNLFLIFQLFKKINK